MAFSPSSQWVASACQNNTIKLWDTGSGKEVFSTRVDAEVQQMKFSSNSKHLVVLTGTNFTRVLLYRVHKGTGWSNSCENVSYFFFLGWFSQGLRYIYMLHPKTACIAKLKFDCWNDTHVFPFFLANNVIFCNDRLITCRPRGISRLWEYANQILKKRRWWVSYEKLHYLYSLLLVFCLLSLSQQKKRMCQHFWDVIKKVFLCNISVYCLYIHAYRFNFYLYYWLLIFFLISFGHRSYMLYHIKTTTKRVVKLRHPCQSYNMGSNYRLNTCIFCVAINARIIPL